MQMLLDFFGGILAFFYTPFIALDIMLKNDGFRILGEQIAKYFGNLF